MKEYFYFNLLWAAYRYKYYSQGVLAASQRPCFLIAIDRSETQTIVRRKNKLITEVIAPELLLEILTSSKR